MIFKGILIPWACGCKTSVLHLLYQLPSAHWAVKESPLWEPAPRQAQNPVQVQDAYPAPFWTVSCITAPWSTSKKSHTGWKNARNLYARSSRLWTHYLNRETLENVTWLRRKTTKFGLRFLTISSWRWQPILSFFYPRQFQFFLFDRVR